RTWRNHAAVRASFGCAEGLPRRPKPLSPADAAPEGVAFGCDRRGPRAPEVRRALDQKPGLEETGWACRTAGPAARSACGAVKKTASCSEVAAGSTFTNNRDSPRGTWTLSTIRSWSVTVND